MSQLMRTSSMAGLPVVTFAGDDVAQLRDLIFSDGGGEIAGFTLAGRGFFSGPKHTVLPWREVVGIGPDAAVIRAEDDLVDRKVYLAELENSAAERAAQQTAGTSTDAPATVSGNVIGSTVLTDAGTALGKVSDVIVEIGAFGSGQADVIGYEVEQPGTSGKVLIPLPDTLSASGEHVMVPAAVTNFQSDNLESLQRAVIELRKGSSS